MWIPTKAEAVEMFALHLEARYRSGSLKRARKTAEVMKAKGDHEGHKIWNDVADRVEHLRQTERIALRRQFEAT
jgi:hypothetical protein